MNEARWPLIRPVGHRLPDDSGIKQGACCKSLVYADTPGRAAACSETPARSIAGRFGVDVVPFHGLVHRLDAKDHGPTLEDADGPG